MHACAESLVKHIDEGVVQCRACARCCTIADGTTGFCGVRRSTSGHLLSVMYGRPAAAHTDPVEKKPLYHVYPGSRAYSIGTLGCTMRCHWCQNCSIAMPDNHRIEAVAGHSEQPPELIVEAAIRQGADGIAYTYNEPTVWIEYVHDVAAAAARVGLYNVWVSNGGTTVDAVRYIAPHLTAANIDLKSFRDSTCRRYTGLPLQPVLDSLEYFVRHTAVWVEVTMLLIPDINDSPEEIQDACRFVAGLSPDIPLHFSAFYPACRMTGHAAASPELLQSARRIALKEGLRYVYLGNVADEGATACPDCGDVVLCRSDRGRYTARFAGHCPGCGTAIPGIWRGI